MFEFLSEVLEAHPGWCIDITYPNCSSAVLSTTYKEVTVGDSQANCLVKIELSSSDMKGINWLTFTPLYGELKAQKFSFGTAHGEAKNLLDAFGMHQIDVEEFLVWLVVQIAGDGLTMLAIDAFVAGFKLNMDESKQQHHEKKQLTAKLSEFQALLEARDDEFRVLDSRCKALGKKNKLLLKQIRSARGQSIISADQVEAQVHSIVATLEREKSELRDQVQVLRSQLDAVSQMGGAPATPVLTEPTVDIDIIHAYQSDIDQLNQELEKLRAAHDAAVTESDFFKDQVDILSAQQGGRASRPISVFNQLSLEDELAVGNVGGALDVLATASEADEMEVLLASLQEENTSLRQEVERLKVVEISSAELTSRVIELEAKLESLALIEAENKALRVKIEQLQKPTAREAELSKRIEVLERQLSAQEVPELLEGAPGLIAAELHAQTKIMKLQNAQLVEQVASLKGNSADLERQKGKKELMCRATHCIDMTQYMLDRFAQELLRREEITSEAVKETAQRYVTAQKRYGRWRTLFYGVPDFNPALCKGVLEKANQRFATINSVVGHVNALRLQLLTFSAAVNRDDVEQEPFFSGIQKLLEKQANDLKQLLSVSIKQDTFVQLLRLKMSTSFYQCYTKFVSPSISSDSVNVCFSEIIKLSDDCDISLKSDRIAITGQELAVTVSTVTKNFDKLLVPEANMLHPIINRIVKESGAIQILFDEEKYLLEPLADTFNADYEQMNEYLSSIYFKDEDHLRKRYACCLSLLFNTLLSQLNFYYQFLNFTDVDFVAPSPLVILDSVRDSVDRLVPIDTSSAENGVPSQYLILSIEKVDQHYRQLTKSIQALLIEWIKTGVDIRKRLVGLFDSTFATNLLSDETVDALVGGASLFDAQLPVVTRRSPSPSQRLDRVIPPHAGGGDANLSGAASSSC